LEKKWSALKDAGYRIVVIDQHSEAVATVQKQGWFPVNSRPTVSVNGSRERMNMLGAVTDPGELQTYLGIAALSGGCAVNIKDRLRLRIDGFCRFECPKPVIRAFAVMFARWRPLIVGCVNGCVW
jgi:hypothetical protein